MKKFIVCIICLISLVSSSIFSNVLFADDVSTSTPSLDKYSISLGDAYFNTNKTTFTFPDASVYFPKDSSGNTSNPTLLSITVSDGSVSLDSSVNTYNAKIVNDYGNTHKSYTLLWDSNNNSNITKSVVENIIKSFTFTYKEGMKVTVSLNGQTTNLSSLLYSGTSNDYTTNSNDITLTSWVDSDGDIHYYLYVPYEHNKTNNSGYLRWTLAYNYALDFKLGGMQGYLATITKVGEQDQLSNLADGNAWIGATALKPYTGTNYNGNNIEPNTSESDLLNGNKIYIDSSLTADKDVLTYVDGYNGAHGANANQIFTRYYYWAAGPEAGTRLPNTSYTEIDGKYYILDSNGDKLIEMKSAADMSATGTGNGTNLHSIIAQRSNDWELESCAALYVGGLTGLNDIPERNSNYKLNNVDTCADGYIVEFGNWTGHDETDTSKECQQVITIDSTEQSSYTKYSIYLDEAYYNSDKTTFSFPNASVNYKDDGDKPTLLTITVSDGSVSLDSSVDTYGAQIITDVNAEHKSYTLLWDSSTNFDLTKDKIDKILQSFKYTYKEGMTITASMNGNSTNLSSLLYSGTSNDYTTNSSDITLTSWVDGDDLIHYYLYVPYVHTSNVHSMLRWTDAYKYALSFKLGGMQGYLATITKVGEQEQLSNLANSNVWIGATALKLYDGTNYSDEKVKPNTSETNLLDGTLTSDGEIPFLTNNVNNYKLTYVDGYRNKADGTSLAMYYYWANGPEAGQRITNKAQVEDSDKYYLVDGNGNKIIQLLKNGEPSQGFVKNSDLYDGERYVYPLDYENNGATEGEKEACAALYVGDKEGINDIPERNIISWGAYSDGYIVEFGNWDNHDRVNTNKQCKQVVTLNSEPTYTKIDNNVNFEYIDGFVSGINSNVDFTSVAVFNDTNEKVDGSKRTLDVGESVVIKVPNGFIYEDGKSYDLYFEVTNVSDIDVDYSGDVSEQGWKISNTNNSYISLYTQNSRNKSTSLNYKMYIKDGSDDAVKSKEMNITAGPCYLNSNSEYARVYSDDNTVYTDIDNPSGNISYSSTYDGYTVNSNDNSKSDKYILGHGTNEDDFGTYIKFGYSKGNDTGTAEFVIGYFKDPECEDITVKHDGNSHSLTIKVENNATITYYKDAKCTQQYESNPSFSDIGEHVVYYKVSGGYYDSNKVYSNKVTITKPSDDNSPVDITLNDAVYNSGNENFSFPNSTVTFAIDENNNDVKPSILSVTVSDGSILDVSSIENYGAVVIKDKNSKSVNFIWNNDKPSKDQVETLLHALKFTYVDGMKVTATIDENDTDISGLLTQDGKLVTGVTLTQWADNGHYYLYVPHIPTANNNLSFISWSEAYNLALSYKFGGNKGYLATLTLSGEQEYLSNLADSNVWVGATALVNNNGTKINGETIDISKDGQLKYVDGFESAAVAYKKVTGTSGSSSVNKDGSLSPITKYYYWAAGPEAGQSIIKGDTISSEDVITLYNPNNAARKELNAWPTGTSAIPRYGNVIETSKIDGKVNGNYESCAAVYVGNTIGFNDIPEGNYYYQNTNASAKGYIVEFGGWNEDETVVASRKDTDTKTLTGINSPAKVSVSVNDKNDKVDITIDGINTEEYYALLDKDGNVIKNNVTNGTNSKTSDSNGWFNKGSDTSNTLVFNDLDVSKGPYYVVKTTNNTITPTTTTEHIGLIITASYTGNHVTFYKESSLYNEVSHNSYDTYKDSGDKSVYLKVNDGYEYEENPVIENATVEKIDTGLYKVTYKIADKQATNITLIAPDPIKPISADKIKFTLDNKIYDGESISVSNISVDDEDDLKASDYTITYYDKDGNVLTEAPKDAGTYKVKVEINKTGYKGSKTQTVTISKKDITVSFKVSNKVYDGSTNATITEASIDSNEIVNNDEVGVSYSKATATFNDKNVGTSKTVTATDIVLTGDKANNYNLKTIKNTNANITVKEVTIEGLEVSDKVYDGNNNATITSKSYTINGLISGDNLTINRTNAKAIFDSAEVGLRTATATGFELSGNDKDNYQLTSQPTTHAQITKQDISSTVTVSLSSESKTYDGNTVSVTEVKNAETTLKNTDYTVKWYKVNEDSSYDKTKPLTNDPKDAGSYHVVIEVNTNNQTARIEKAITIQPKDLEIEVTAKEREYAIETDEFGLSSASTKAEFDEKIDTTGVGNEKYKLTITNASYSDGDAGINKPITITEKDWMGNANYTLTDNDNSGFNKSNYNITIKASGTITKAKLTKDNLTIENYSGEYDGNYHNISVSGNVDGLNITYYPDETKLPSFTGQKNVTSEKMIYFKITSNNYEYTSSDSDYGTITITAKPLTIDNLVIFDKQLDGNADAKFSVANATLNGLITGDDVSIDDSNAKASFETFDKTGENIKVTTSNFALKGSDKDNYTLTQPEGVASIKNPSIVVDGKEYDGNPLSVTVQEYNEATKQASTIDSKNYDITCVDKDGNSIDLSNSYPVNAGTYTFTVKFKDEKASLGELTKTVTIYPKKLTVSVPITTKVYDGITLANEDNPDDNRAPATIDKDNISITGVVNNESVSINADNAIATFRDPNADTDKPVTVTGLTLTGDNSNNYIIDSIISTKGTITKKKIKIVISAEDKEYDGTDSVVYTWDEIETNDNDLVDVWADVDATNVTAKFENSDVGENKKVTAKGFALTGDSILNFELESPDVETTASIKPKMGSVTINLNSEGKMYDGQEITILSITIKGDNETTETLNNGCEDTFENIDNDSCTFKYKWRKKDTNLSGGDIDVPKNVGTYTVTVSDIKSSSFKVDESISKTVTISKRPVTIVGVTFKDKEYDGNSNAEVDLTNARFENLVSGENAKVEIANGGGYSKFKDEKVGNGKTVTTYGYFTLGDASTSTDKNSNTTTSLNNYYIANDPSGYANITKKKVTISLPSDFTKEYDGTKNVDFGSYTYKFKNGDETVTISNIKGTLSSANVLEDGVSIDSITSYDLSEDKDNYEIIFDLSNKVTITPKELTISGLTVADKVYNGTTNVSFTSAQYSLEGIVSGDNVTLNFNSASGNYSDKNVGENKNITITSVSTSGNDSNNYKVADSISGKGNIFKKDVTISGLKVYDKEYDGNTSATIKENNTYIIIGKVSNDDLSVNEGNVSFIDSNVGSNKDVTASGFSLSGNDSSNYNLVSQPTAKANITQKDITKNINVVITNVVNGSKEYNAKPLSIKEITYGNTTFTKDEYTITYIDSDGNTLNEAPKDVGEYKVLITINTGNYKGTITKEVNITKRPITIKADDTSVSKGGNVNYSYSIESGSLLGYDVLDVKYSDIDTSKEGTYSLTITCVDKNYEVTCKEGTVKVYSSDDSLSEGNTTIFKEGESTSTKFTSPSLDTSVKDILDTDIFTELEKEEFKDTSESHNAKVYLVISDTDKTLLSEDIIKDINALAKSYVGEDAKIAYFDADLYKQIDNEQASQITSINKEISVTVKIPDELINTNSSMIRSYKIIRVHENKVEAIDTTYNEANKTITFKSNKFSTFAIAYSDKQIVNTNTNTGSVKSCEDVHGKGYVWMGEEKGCRYKVSNTSSN